MLITSEIVGLKMDENLSTHQDTFKMKFKSTRKMLKKSLEVYNEVEKKAWL